MEVNEQLIRAITQAVVEQLHPEWRTAGKRSSDTGNIRSGSLCRKNTDASETFL